MTLSILPTTTIVLVLSLLESVASSSSTKLHRIRSDVAATTNSPHSTSWQRRSLLMDEMPDVGLEDVDVLLFGGSSMSMSFSYTYNGDNDSSVGNDIELPLTSPATLLAQALVQDMMICAGVVFSKDSCLATTITEQMLGGGLGRRYLTQTSSKNGMLPQFLQSPNDVSCIVPKFGDEEEDVLLLLLQGASVDCGEVTEKEFNEVFTSMKKLFSSKSCWEKVLCDMTYITTLSYKIYFEYAENCAGVDLDVPECVYDKVLDLLVMFSETSPPENSSSPNFYLVSTYLITPAVDHCDAKEVNKDKATSDILAILQSMSSPTCMSAVRSNEVGSTTSTTTTTTTTNELIDEATGEIVVIHHEDLPSTTTTPSSTSNTQAILPPATTTIHGETFANIPTSPAATTATASRSLLPLISIAGGLVVIGAIIGGVYRSKKQKKTSNSNNNNGGGIINLDEKSIQSITSKSTEEMSSSSADEENNNSRISSSSMTSLASMNVMSTLVTNSGRVDRRASI